GCELDARKVEIKRLGQRSHQQRLAQPGDPFQQGMPADKQASENSMDDLVVADNDASDFLVNGLVTLGKLFGSAFNRIGKTHGVPGSLGLKMKLGNGFVSLPAT